MRKIETIKFDDLAEIYPIISKHEQSEYFGRALVYNSEGKFIPNLTYLPLGDTANLYVLKPEGEGTVTIGGYDIPYYEISSSTTIPFSQATDMEKNNIILEMARSLGITNISTVSGEINSRHPASCNKNGNIEVNVRANMFIDDDVNYFDILLTLIHEKHHADTLLDFGTNQSEYEAYLTIYNSEYYSSCSTKMKNSIDKGLSNNSPN